MKIHLGTLSALVLVTFGLGILVGHALFNDSQAVDRLSKEIEDLQSSTSANDPRHRTYPRPEFVTGSEPSTNLPALVGSARAYPVTPVDESKPLTDEGLAYMTELAKLEQAGWYFLQDQNPGFNASRASSRQYAYEKTVNEEGLRHRAALAELGVDATTREQIVDHIGKIAAAHVEVSGKVVQLLRARQDLETRLERISPEAVSQLKESDAMRRAGLEYEGHDNGQVGLGEYLAQRLGGPIEGEQQETLIRLVQEADAVTAKYALGLFDEVSLPVMGETRAAERSQDFASQVEAAGERLREVMSQSELPAEYQQVVRDYYADKAQYHRALSAQFLMGGPPRPSWMPPPPPPPDFLPPDPEAP